MELADPRLISQLLTKARSDKPLGSRRSTGSRMRKTTVSPDERVYQPPAYKTRRFRCGLCPKCEDNARWERIFAEKFPTPPIIPVLSSGTSHH
jgi:hypothetical protein